MLALLQSQTPNPVTLLLNAKFQTKTKIRGRVTFALLRIDGNNKEHNRQELQRKNSDRS